MQIGQRETMQGHVKREAMLKECMACTGLGRVQKGTPALNLLEVLSDESNR